jgi:NAD+ kinase
VKIGLVVHAGREDSLTVARTAAESLRGHGATVIVTRPAQTDDVDPDRLTTVADPVDPDHFATDLDLAMSLGGDGTFLRAAHLCRDQGVPVMGVNLGRLGFLAEVEVDDLGTALAAIRDRRFAG